MMPNHMIPASMRLKLREIVLICKRINFFRCYASASCTQSVLLSNDFTVSDETKLRQNRARTILWSGDNENYHALENIKIPG